jgi:hypothetical protein
MRAFVAQMQVDQHFDAPMTAEEIAAWEGNESDAELF